MKAIRCVVTGMHRGGTTWLGQALDAIPGWVALHEPFNRDNGLRGVPHWYLDARLPQDVAFFHRQAAALTDGTARFTRRANGRALPQALAVRLLGNGSERAYRRALRGGDRALVLKDPFLLTMVPELVRSGIPTVVSVRHPAAIARSLRRVGWHVPNEIFAGRGPAGGVDAARDGEIAAVCAFWREVYGPVLGMLAEGPVPGLYLAHHEAIFAAPRGFLDSLAAFLGLDDPAQAAALAGFVDHTTRAATVTPEHRRQHDFARDSRTLSRAWRVGLSPRELAAYEALVGADYALLHRRSADALARHAAAEERAVASDPVQIRRDRPSPSNLAGGPR